jgi:hypothetical protein
MAEHKGDQHLVGQFHDAQVQWHGANELVVVVVVVMVALYLLGTCH